MLPGFLTTCAPGGHSPLFTRLNVATHSGGVRVRFRMASGYAQYARLLVDGNWQGAPVWAPDDLDTELAGVFLPRAGAHAVSLVPHGEWAETAEELRFQQTYFGLVADRFHVKVTAELQFFSYGDAGALSNWDLAGPRRFENCEPMPGRPQWAVWTVTLVDVAGTRTVSLYAAGQLVAHGSRSGDGVVTLAADNGSGLSGTVTVAYVEDLDNVTLIARWPERFNIHYQKDELFEAGDFPRTPEAYLPDDGHSNEFTWRSEALAEGTYYALVRQQDENGNESENVGGTALAIVTIPEPPGVPSYYDGNYAHTRIQFQASATPGAFYRVYDSAESGLLDFEDPWGTFPGSGLILLYLPSISAGWTGIRYVAVRAIVADVEEHNAQVLAIEYLDGEVVLPRPPAPAVSHISTAGLTLTVAATINVTEQLAAPATIELFLFEPGGAPDYEQADGSAVLPAAVGGTIHVNVSALAAADGHYCYALRTKTAGGVQSDNVDTYGPVRLTDDPAAEPGAAEIELGY